MGLAHPGELVGGEQRQDCAAEPRVFDLGLDPDAGPLLGARPDRDLVELDLQLAIGVVMVEELGMSLCPGLAMGGDERLDLVALLSGQVDVVEEEGERPEFPEIGGGVPLVEPGGAVGVAQSVSLRVVARCGGDTGGRHQCGNQAECGKCRALHRFSLSRWRRFGWPPTVEPYGPMRQAARPPGQEVRAPRKEA